MTRPIIHPAQAVLAKRRADAATGRPRIVKTAPPAVIRQAELADAEHGLPRHEYDEIIRALEAEDAAYNDHADYREGLLILFGALSALLALAVLAFVVLP